MTATNQFCKTKERSGLANPQWSAAKLTAVSNALTRAAQRFRRGLKTYMHTVQVARMQSVLANLSDFQLDQIGITRAGIVAYSERLFSDDTGFADDGRGQNNRS